MIPDILMDWIRDHKVLLWYGTIASVVVCIASLVILPAFIVRIPADYFAHAVRPPRRWAKQPAWIRWSIMLGKNVLGLLLRLAGIAMLVLPGQGVLTLLAGFLLIDMPGKYPFEKWLIRRPWIARPINWLRRRRHQPPLQTSAKSSTTLPPGEAHRSRKAAKTSAVRGGGANE